MVLVRIRLPGFCKGRARVRAQPQQYKQSYNSVYKNDDVPSSSNNSIQMNFKTDSMIQPESESREGNRIMVVVDFSLETKNALGWALSHAVLARDIVSLLFVTKKGANCGGDRANELLGSMKKMCEMRRPGVLVEVTLVEGKERGPKIVEEAKKQKVSMLVLGQRKKTLFSRLRSMCICRRKTRKTLVEYCIQNSICMTIAVRRKSRKCGGFSITTKRHKNFWLLA